ncbi:MULTISPECIES: TonB-dependent receptor plug domain-containing protein [unclassified Acidovorax]|uniref:TonB-dependent receptor plug domain-containing protein n=1 Tax=unclassified Acidovorax TaxID=2684926 RepID=UPI000A6639FB
MSYGINDLAVMLDGVPGVNTKYDMRGEGVMIRGFNADSGDIYRDGVRESGQVRRSTANVERIEILKARPRCSTAAAAAAASSTW